MKSRFARVLLIGVMIPDLHATPPAPAGPERLPQKSTSAVLTRHSEFDRLPSAGRFARFEIVSFALDGGRIVVDWKGQAAVSDPSRIDLGDLDAEWMAHTPAAPRSDPALTSRFLLARRDLVPDEHERCFTIHLFGDTAQPSQVQLLISVDSPAAASTVTNLSFTQSNDSVRLAIWGLRAGVRVEEQTFEAQDLPELIRQHPAVTTYLSTAIRKMMNLDIQ